MMLIDDSLLTRMTVEKLSFVVLIVRRFGNITAKELKMERQLKKRRLRNPKRSQGERTKVGSQV
jgi:hypothetical protein